MSDLRKAAEMALERLESHEYWMDEEAIQALRQALAQPEQEQKIKHSLSVCKSIQSRVYVGDEMVSLSKMTLEEAGLMPKREWVGITKEDKKEILEMTQPDERGYVIAITEAKLKEKNT